MSEYDHSYSSPTKQQEQQVVNINTESGKDATLNENIQKVQKSINFSNNNIYEPEGTKTNDIMDSNSKVLKSQENETKNESNMDFECSDSQEQGENNKLVDDSAMDTSLPENVKGDNSFDEFYKLDQSQSNNETDKGTEELCTSKRVEELDVTGFGSEDNDGDKTGCEKDHGSKSKQQDERLNVEDNEIQKENGKEEALKEKGGADEIDAATSPLSKTGDDEMDNKKNKKMDEDSGIPIDENKIVKREDVYGPGKRSRRSAIHKDYLDDSDLQEKLKETPRDESPKSSRHQNAHSSAKKIFKKLPGL